MENSSATRQEILGLEKKFWSAMQKNDYQQAVDLTDFPCVLAGAQGSQVVDKDSFKKMFDSGAGRIRDFEFDESSVEVRQLSPETAVIAYKVKSTFGAEGQEKTIQAVDASTWVKRNGKWVCAMHTETELKN